MHASKSIVKNFNKEKFEKIISYGYFFYAFEINPYRVNSKIIKGKMYQNKNWHFSFDKYILKNLHQMKVSSTGSDKPLRHSFF